MVIDLWSRLFRCRNLRYGGTIALGFLPFRGEPSCFPIDSPQLVGTLARAEVISVSVAGPFVGRNVLSRPIVMRRSTVRRKMDRNALGKDELSLTPDEKELHQQVIEQFYAGSVERYGIDSEQARALARLLKLGRDSSVLHSTSQPLASQANRA
jgi:hypothetical protein